MGRVLGRKRTGLDQYTGQTGFPVRTRGAVPSATSCLGSVPMSVPTLLSLVPCFHHTSVTLFFFQTNKRKIQLILLLHVQLISSYI